MSLYGLWSHFCVTGMFEVQYCASACWGREMLYWGVSLFLIPLFRCSYWTVRWTQCPKYSITWMKTSLLCFFSTLMNMKIPSTLSISLQGMVVISAGVCGIQYSKLVILQNDYIINLFSFKAVYIYKISFCSLHDWKKNVYWFIILDCEYRITINFVSIWKPR